MDDDTEPDSPDRLAVTARETGESAYTGVRDTVLTGVAILVPIAVTVYVLSLVLDFIAEAFAPVVDVLQWLGVVESFEHIQVIRLLIDLGIYPHVIGFFAELIAVGVLLGLVMVVGSVGRNRYGERIIDLFDLVITSIPGVGTVYKTFRRMGDAVLDDGAEDFQEVKLVQCLDDDMYVLGFQTGQSPGTIEDSTGHEEMVAVFLPLAPNPVTGGFLTYVPAGQVYDIDMTVEEGIRSILTSGIATGEDADGRPELTMADLGEVADFEQLQQRITTEGGGDQREP